MNERPTEGMNEVRDAGRRTGRFSFSTVKRKDDFPLLMHQCDSRVDKNHNDGNPNNGTGITATSQPQRSSAASSSSTENGTEVLQRSDWLTKSVEIASTDSVPFRIHP